MARLCPILAALHKGRRPAPQSGYGTQSRVVVCAAAASFELSGQAPRYITGGLAAEGAAGLAGMS
jgi:hypothetical protein